MTTRRRTLGFEFLRPARSGRVVLEADGIVLSAGDKLLLDGASLVLERGEHVALVGPNGSGKTTLLETLLGEREPDAGRIKLGHGVVPAYFSQHEAELPEHGTILEVTSQATGLPRPQAQNLLGRFLFSGWETHEKQVSVLSGGERRRLALAPSSRRARTSSCSTSPRTTSTSRAERRSRRARGVPGHRPARVARPGRARRGAGPDRLGRGPGPSLDHVAGQTSSGCASRRLPADRAGGQRRKAEAASSGTKAAHGARPGREADRGARATRCRAGGTARGELDPHGPPRLVHVRARGARRAAGALGDPLRGGAGGRGLASRPRVSDTGRNVSAGATMPAHSRFGSYDEPVAAHEWRVPAALQHRRRRLRQAPARQARDGLGGLPTAPRAR